MAYRRGFDHAVEYLLMDCGLPPEQIMSLQYKQKIALWRAGARGFTYDLRNDAPRMTADEAKQIVSYMNAAFWNAQGDQSNA
jgi:hypothetical protein